ncbi:hypothetical protein [Allobaculum sp. JKK-2023]|uniref:hypothetical protein n=1 Tax=Allobaculum sp. JKK-2023 TaxID=3108943 RepID=UPI002B053A23|nr:hypothetical protein [Allobaculum sp. JKK-2023]
MQSYILDARTIDPKQDPADFLCKFYSLPSMSMPELKRSLYADPDVRITEVFNWPVEGTSWKAIASALEIIQQHSASFYVIWGPETCNAIELDEERLENEGKPVLQSTTSTCPDEDR